MCNIKQFLSGNKLIKVILIGFLAIVLALAIFSAGMFVGFRKARFSYQWGENYHRLFGGPPLGRPMEQRGSPRQNFMREARGDDFINPNGVSGLVIKYATGTLYIKGDDNTERNVLVSDQTLIRHGQDTILPEDLKADEQVVILGVPSSTGQIEAKLIRVFDKK
jgi:hypothetical protein